MIITHDKLMCKCIEVHGVLQHFKYNIMQDDLNRNGNLSILPKAYLVKFNYNRNTTSHIIPNIFHNYLVIVNALNYKLHNSTHIIIIIRQSFPGICVDMMATHGES